MKSEDTVANPEREQKAVLNRLARARGQLDALITALESGADCRKVVVQLAAVSKALDKAGYVIISSAMRQCLTPGGQDGEDAMTPEELEKLFMILS